MPSVFRLLEAREKKVREEVARLREKAERIQAALDAAEVQVERLSQARETVTEMLAEPVAESAGQVRAAAVPGATVPRTTSPLTPSSSCSREACAPGQGS